MISPAMPINESERLEALHSYDVLDTLPEEEYDAITKLAAEICGTPISLITLIDEDRQWFKSSKGIDVGQTPRENALCAHAILTPSEPLIVPDTSQDKRFINNPLVTSGPGIAFYAGIPLVTKSGHALGSLCVIDRESHTIEPSKIEALKILANQVVKLLELRKTVRELKETKLQLEQTLESVNDFANIVAHDIQAPVRNMGLFADIIVEDYSDLIDDEGKHMLRLLSENAVNAREYINGVLKYSRATHLTQLSKEAIDLNKFFEQTINSMQIPEHIKIEVDKDLPKIVVTKIALQQIINNLLSNAIKYIDKAEGIIEVKVSHQDDLCHISIKDNGRGIPKTLTDKIFDIFYMVDKKDVKEKGSSGIGLSVVKKIVTRLNGVVVVISEEHVGSTFTITIPV